MIRNKRSVGLCKRCLMRSACGLTESRKRLKRLISPCRFSTIGVEITMYRSGRQSKAARDFGVESEWDILEQASKTFRDQRPDLANINVGLMLRGAVPPRNRHAEFMKEIAAFMHDHAAAISQRR